MNQNRTTKLHVALTKRWPGFLCALLLSSFSALGETNHLVKASHLKKLSFDELLNVRVTSVSGYRQKLSQSPSAIQVITGEDIRRSGASSLPEALRLAPNLQVAQVNSHTWSISARGFNNSLANKLLVMIDGRSVYTPLFAGVFWNEQHVMLEDIDRIEVISGPGATLWGANAVNGVINIVTKNSRDTQGTIFSAGAGSLLDKFGSLRYGDKLSDNLFFRLYGMGFERDVTLRRSGHGAQDDWAVGQGGFRMDWFPAGTDDRTLLLEGNGYAGRINIENPNTTKIDGQNVLARWSQQLEEDSEFSVQAYWDRTYRRVPNSYSETLNTYDLSLQHRLPVGERHILTWGAGYRLHFDEINNLNPAVLSFLPPDRSIQLFTGFLKDRISLVPDKLDLTLGSKIEHNDFSGWEFQPSARIAWMPSENQVFWGAVSRAVRSPSRIDSDLTAPTVTIEGDPYFLRRNPGFDSEELLAFELGYRFRPVRSTAISIATFYNIYDDLRSIDIISTNMAEFGNNFEGKTWGVEVAGHFQCAHWWRLRTGYTFLHKELDPADSRVTPSVREGNDPCHQVVAQSMMNFRGFMDRKDGFYFDVTGRYVDDLSNPPVPGYFSLSAKLTWTYMDKIDISIVGQNLLDDQHPEFGARASRLEIPRSVYGKVTWRF